MVVAAAVVGGLLTIGFALEAVLYRVMDWPHGVEAERLFHSSGQYPLVLLSYWAMLVTWTTIGLLLGAGFYRSGGNELVAVVLALAMVVVTGYGIGFNGLPFVGAVLGVAEVPLAVTLALCLTGLLPGAAATWAMARDIRSATARPEPRHGPGRGARARAAGQMPAGSRVLGAGRPSSEVSSAILGSQRSSQAGIHQFHRPTSRITAGTRIVLTRVASIRTATASPNPMSLNGTSRPAAKAANTVTMTRAAEVIVRAVLSRPLATASWLSPVRRYFSRIRLSRNTS